MTSYAIGDIQGCYKELLLLLDKINFDSNHDQLWFVGDLVNRGPASLETINFVMNLGDTAITVLGNHDLHLLAVAEGFAKQHKADTLDSILRADNKKEILTWIRKQKLFHHDETLNFSMVHAGISPQWNIEQAIEFSNEVTQVLSSDDYLPFLKVMYGNQPDVWDEELAGHDRLRYIVNCFTRMRYISDENELNFPEKGAPGTQAEGLQPWFIMGDRKTNNNNIIFGHWSTAHLGNIKDFTPYHVYPLDTGCLWGGELTALRIEDKTYFSVPAIK